MKLQHTIHVRRFRDFVTNSHSQLHSVIASQGRNKALRASEFCFNPELIAAIVTRKPKNIERSLRQYLSNDDIQAPSLPFEQYIDLSNNPIIGSVLDEPVKLAIKLCDTVNTEITQSNGPTRYDVLYSLAENWDGLIRDAKLKGYVLPDLKETLRYAAKLKDSTALYIFINGLSDENRAVMDRMLEESARKKQSVPTSASA